MAELRETGAMTQRPSLAFGASLFGAVWVLYMAILAVNNSILFPPGVISGLVIIICGATLYERPHLHAVTGAIILAVALAAFFMFYFFLFPAPAESLPFAMMFVIGPILAGIGGLLGLSWRPTRSSRQLGH